MHSFLCRILLNVELDILQTATVSMYNRKRWSVPVYLTERTEGEVDLTAPEELLRLKNQEPSL